MFSLVNGESFLKFMFKLTDFVVHLLKFGARLVLIYNFD
jgi:hypothetical protein